MPRRNLTFIIKPDDGIPSDILAILTKVNTASRHTIRDYGEYPRAVDVLAYGSVIKSPEVSESMARNLNGAVSMGLLNVNNGRYSLTIKGQEVLTPKSPDFLYCNMPPREKARVRDKSAKAIRETRVLMHAASHDGRTYRNGRPVLE